MATLAVTRRYDLTDAQWAALAAMLPASPVWGRPPKWTRRQLIDGIRWRIRIGSPWRDVPAIGAQRQPLGRAAGAGTHPAGQVNQPRLGVGAQPIFEVQRCQAPPDPVAPLSVVSLAGTPDGRLLRAPHSIALDRANANGQSGYFDRPLNANGREGSRAAAAERRSYGSSS